MNTRYLYDVTSVVFRVAAEDHGAMREFPRFARTALHRHDIMPTTAPSGKSLVRLDYAKNWKTVFLRCE
jgi:hypothetical protein